MIERRTGERLQASLPARVAFRGRYRLRAVVRNASETGAKLALDKPVDLPAEFVLSFAISSRNVTTKLTYGGANGSCLAWGWCHCL
jgi:hypothetical protein